MRRPLVIYDFETAPFRISSFMRKIWFSFLSVILRIFPASNLKFKCLFYFFIFLIYKEIQNGAVAKSYMTNGPPHIWGNICAFPHILGSSSSYMTVQLLYSEFPYIWGNFDFFSVKSEAARCIIPTAISAVISHFSLSTVNKQLRIISRGPEKPPHSILRCMPMEYRAYKACVQASAGLFLLCTPPSVPYWPAGPIHTLQTYCACGLHHLPG